MAQIKDPDRIENQKDRELIELLQKMIQIPSWVPDDEAGKWTQNENRLIDFIEAWLLKNTDLMVVRQKLNYGRFNLIASKGNPQVIFLAHTDTVAPPINSPYSPLGGEIHDGRVWGRGSSDMKCGIATLMQASALSSEADNYAIIFYADEEYDFLGMKTLIKGYPDLKPRLLISADGSDLRMGYGCRGLIEIRARVLGQTAHAASGKGKNAILGVYRIVDDLTKYFQDKSDPVMGQTSMNLAYVIGGKEVEEEGVVDGKLVKVGQEGNVVPDIAEFVIDIRPNSPDISVETITEVIEETARKTGVNVEIVNVRHNLRAWITPKDEIQKYADIARETCKLEEIKFNDPKKGGYLDLQMFWESHGRPVSFVFGAGSGKTEHADDENVEIDKVIKVRDFFEVIMKNP